MSNLPSITYSSMEKAGLPAPLKSQMQAWIDRTLAAGGQTQESAKAIAKMHAVAAGEALRMTGEAGVYGSILGAVHAALPNGLDVPVPGSKMSVPLDGVGMVVGIIGATFAAQEPYGIGKTLAQGGAACAAIFGFRKVNDFVLQLTSGITPNGGAAINGKIGKAASFNGEGSSFGGTGGLIGTRTRTGLSRIAAAAAGL